MEVQNYLPLSETSFLIIFSLASAPKHGYAIIREVEALSDKRVVLATGTLYSALRRMLEDGWIERVLDENTNAGGRDRKRYQLSKFGWRLLGAEINRLKKLVKLTHLHDVKEIR